MFGIFPKDHPGYGYIDLAPVKLIDRRDPEVIEKNIRIYQERLLRGEDLWTGEKLNESIIQELHRFRKQHIE